MGVRKINKGKDRMKQKHKYDIGDVVKIMHLESIGMIIEKDHFVRTSFDVNTIPGYRVLISGEPGKTYVYYEYEIEKI